MEKLSLIPMPKSICLGEGTVSVPAAVYSAEYGAEAKVFALYAERLLGIKLCFSGGGITLLRDASLKNGEYRITCGKEGVFAYASGSEGAGYALATLLQLMSAENGSVILPCISIEDRPDSDFRGMMVDLARKWHPFDTLLEFIDLCWFYKISYLHLHFADNESYTLPSRAFPALPTEGRSYTAKEIEELNAYAHARGVELIPEIEVPGHSKAMLSACPHLFCHVGEALAPGSDRIVCVGKQGIMDTLSALTDEVLGLFPNSRYFHIGGDEARISAWDSCEACRAYMREHSISNVRELYTHFVKEMTDIVLSKGRTPIVWEGFPREGSEKLSRNVVVSVFESMYHLSTELIEEGFKVINSTWQPLYITKTKSWTAEYIYNWNIYRWENWWEKSKAYNAPIQLQKTDMVLGGELCSWGCEYEQEIDVMRENLAALAERTWNVEPMGTAEEFRQALNRLVPIVSRAKSI